MYLIWHLLYTDVTFFFFCHSTWLVGSILSGQGFQGNLSVSARSTRLVSYSDCLGRKHCYVKYCETECRTVSLRVAMLAERWPMTSTYSSEDKLWPLPHRCGLISSIATRWWARPPGKATLLGTRCGSLLWTGRVLSSSSDSGHDHINWWQFLGGEPHPCWFL